MTINLLSILISLAMMLTGAAGVETDAVMANNLTIRDFYFSYNDESFKLEPSLNAGVMTGNGAAVFDLSMAAGEESLFPLQLVITEESAALVFEKTGQAFSIDAETLNALVAEAVDLDSLTGDAEFNADLETLKSSWGTMADIGSYKLSDEALADLEAKIDAAFQPVETSEGTDTYEEAEYDVTIERYVLDNDQVFELMDIVIGASEELSAFYAQYFEMLNTTLSTAFAEEGEEAPEITGFRDIYAMIGAEITLDMTGYESADGEFTHAQGAFTMTAEELPEPMVINMDVYLVDGLYDTMVESEYTIDGMNLYIGGISYVEGEDTYFEAVLDLMPEESESLTDADYEDAMSLFISGYEVANEAGGTDASFAIEVNTYESGFAFVTEYYGNADGSGYADIGLDFADAENMLSTGFSMDFSKAAFANAAEGLTPIAVNPGNMEVVQAEFGTAVQSLMEDVQALVENESVNNMITAFSAITSAAVSVETDVADDADYEAVYETSVVPENTELTFEVPTFTYIPEGMVVEDLYVDVEFNSVSCTITDSDYDNTFYVYVYGDTYTSGIESYVFGEDGALNPLSGPVVSVQRDDDAIYADMVDGDIVVSISYYGSDMGIDEIGKILSGTTY